MTIPSRFSEAAFRRYESIIGEIVQAWPQATSFTPMLSVETFAARLRDAMKACAANAAWSTSFDRTAFLAIHEDIVVSLTAKLGSVVCGPKGAPPPAAVETAPPARPLAPVGLIVRQPYAEDIEAVCLLHSHGVLVFPTRIEGTAIDVTLMEQRYDVSVMKIDDTTYEIY